MITSSDEATVVSGYEELAKRINKRKGKGSGKQKLKEARRLLGLSQKDFAVMFGVSMDSVKSWEAPSRPEPQGMVRLLIEMIRDNPDRARKIAESLHADGSASRDSVRLSAKREVA